ncbi:MAG TPA: DUF262 domain-containing HNH endonuclease family protein [Hanamia sp.]
METEKTFSINAKTCTLKYNSQESKGTIFGNGIKYVIPIYQRPYSWTDEQIRKFLSDIFLSYWGNEGDVIEDPMFIGTMQLSVKNNHSVQDIIDGQQRLTTFLILLKVLKQKFPNSEELKSVSLDWLSTRVSNGQQQEYLSQVIQADLTFNDETLNPYLKNASLINQIIEEETKGENVSQINFEVERFVKYLLSNVYFVVIETKALLSKTIQIFKTINTTGLDLNGGDIFKINMFDYLRAKKGKDEQAFEEISKLYETIDEKNKQAKYDVTNINEILSIYQYILIAKNNLPVVLYGYGTDTFYEKLFDTIFNKPQEHFKNNISNLDLSLEEILRVIEARYEWENKWYESAEDMCCYELIRHSRYGRFADNLPTIFIFANPNANRFDFIKKLAKLYFIYSVRFMKSIYEIRDFSYKLIQEIISKSPDEVMQIINNKIGNAGTHNQGYYNLNYFLTENITENYLRKKLICLLSAMLEEDFTISEEKEIISLREKLFRTKIDIEHIQSFGEKEEIPIEWGDEINSIGNLMVLEESLNRSIQHKPYSTKIIRYPTSIFEVVRNQISNFPFWDLANCKIRKQKETQKLLNYIFN